ncbi:exonuclease subunit SbcD [Flammeovirgaceae bacterium SG7u.111]|nr:exonuclease subunit SbcD [Flammeovirgaceae bacterium SG7u.132]WPO37337.1 exonuclease subunit SbcD [Flammeovirgaceae bacterium SG7u.111]
MKVLHTADWHLGKKLNDFSRHDEQVEVLEEICQIADSEAVDVVLIAGDLYDTFNPATESVELFYKTVKKLSKDGRRPVVAIAGNHDSADRIEAPDPLARECGIILAGYPDSEPHPFKLETGLEVTKSAPGFIELRINETLPLLRLILTPYANEARMKQYFEDADHEEALRQTIKKQWETAAETYCDEKGVNLLVAHLFMAKKGAELEKEPEDEKQILHIGGAQVIYSDDVPSQIQYTALGHLHRFRDLHKNLEKAPVVYSGSLLEYSFSEAHQQKFVSIIEAKPGEEASYKSIGLASGKRLHRKKFEVIDDAIIWLKENPDTFVELTIVSDGFLEAEAKKALYSAHKGIVFLIPEIKGGGKIAKGESIDITQNTEDLFVSYFTQKNGVEPDSALMEVFREMMGK